MKLITVLLVCGCMMFAPRATAEQADYILTVVDSSAPVANAAALAPICATDDSWDFGVFPDFGIQGFDGPLTSAGGGPIPPGFLPDNITIDSQLDGPGGDSRGPGGNGLVAIGPSAGFGNPYNAVAANFFNDAYGIDFGKETCQFTWTGTSLLGGGGYDLWVDGVLQFSGLLNDTTYTLTGGPWLELWFHDPDSGAEGLQGEALVAYLEYEVAIDIKFCSDPNAFNCKKKGVLPVTIFGTADFMVEDIDPSTLQLCTADMSACTEAPRDYSYADRGDPTMDLGAAICTINPDTWVEELNPDGFLDLDAAFETSQVKAILGDFCVEAAKGDVSEALVIIGETYDGVPIFSAPADDNTGIDRLVKVNK